MKNWVREFFALILITLYFMILTFPIVVVKVDTEDVSFRWFNLVWVALLAFILSWLWRNFHFATKKHSIAIRNRKAERKAKAGQVAFRIPDGGYWPLLKIALILGGISLVPLLLNLYHVGIISSALMFIVLGLGLNIVVGYGGLLNLGYAAFYAAGAYSYGLLYFYLQFPFWLALPMGAFSGVIFGFIIGFPVLRLRGDYLAIVTLAFGEIVRMVLENMAGFTRGAEGIANIPRPGFFVNLSFNSTVNYIYFICVALVISSIFVIRRLEDSRIGRALEAMREDETAAQSVGIDLGKTKLAAFALGTVWAGIIGVVLAAKTTYINPGSFTLLESIMILVAVVLGGIGSIPGVILGATIVILLPEYFRVLSEYRMLFFGIMLVLMSLFRPQGIIPRKRRHYFANGKRL